VHVWKTDLPGMLQDQRSLALARTETAGDDPRSPHVDGYGVITRAPNSEFLKQLVFSNSRIRREFPPTFPQVFSPLHLPAFPCIPRTFLSHSLCPFPHKDT